MKNLVNVLDVVQDTLLKAKQVGDPDDVLEYKKMTAVVSKSTPEDLENSTTVTPHGSVELPPLADILSDPDQVGCVARKVIFHINQ